MGPAQAANTTASPSSSFAQLSAAISTTSSPKNPPADMSTVTSLLPTATPTTIEKLPANILRLEPNGFNWAIFKMCFSNAMKVTRRWAYFTGLKAGVIRNQLGLCKLILPVQCSCLFFSTSQKLSCLVIRINRYDTPLQKLICRSKKKIVLKEKRKKNCVISLNVFFLL